MFVSTLKSLVQRGTTVNQGGQAVDARLGFSYPRLSQLSEVVTSLRHGNCQERLAEPPSWAFLVGANSPAGNDASRIRAGRSADSWASVFRHAQCSALRIIERAAYGSVSAVKLAEDPAKVFGAFTPSQRFPLPAMIKPIMQSGSTRIPPRMTKD